MLAFHLTDSPLLWTAPGMIRRGIRRRGGRCSTCGYDLRGTPNGPCPECGARGPTLGSSDADPAVDFHSSMMPSLPDSL
jgi:hypothetical protein